MEISELGEFGLIRHLTEDIKPQAPSTIVGVGDDCAVLAPSAVGGGRAEGVLRTLVTTDLLLEGVHFDLTYVPLRHLGYKAVAVNLSDIYAMNGTPRQITVSLGVSKRFTVEDLEELYHGIKTACANYGVDLVGGDTSASMTGLTISITAIGEAAPEDVVLRSTAHDTDLICVTGDLGAAYMGLQLLEREKYVFLQQAPPQPSPQGEGAAATSSGQTSSPLGGTGGGAVDFSGREYLIQRQLMPEPRRDVVEALRKAGIRPTSMMDISDGLSSELHHICHASNVGCRIYEERIPLDYQTAVTAEEFNMNVTTAALNGGEDYELLFTVPLTAHDEVVKIEGVRVIGHITRPELGKLLVTREGQEFDLKAQGWQAPM